MIVGLVNLIIYIIILGLLFWVLQYAISAIPLPEPFAKVAQVLLILVAVVIVIILLLQLVGGAGDIHLPGLKS
jgi:hypothetical protein